MSLAVDKPILNNPFREPKRYWLYEQDTGLPRVAPGRRPAGYYYRDPSRAREASAQMSMLADETFVQLEIVNEIRERVGRWREQGYPGATSITKRLLEHWQQSERERQLFFCQREAAETIVWLTETEAGRRMANRVPTDVPADPDSVERGYGPLTRYCAKMATGSGKTVVMAMVIAWSVLNKVHGSRSNRYSDAVLILCPNLTIKERLGGAPRDLTLDGQEPERALIPGARGNYYERFDLVPAGLLADLGQARIHFNWPRWRSPRQRPARWSSAAARATRRSAHESCATLAAATTCWSSMTRPPRLSSQAARRGGRQARGLSAEDKTPSS